MGQRLLIVDSDRTFLAEQRVSLESAFEVEILPSPDGDSLLSRADSGDIAAVLICVEVSENKGYAFCSNLRKLQAQKPALAGIKVALISAKATEEEYKRHQSLKGRADLYLHKPIPPGALVAALSQLVPPRPVDPHNPLGDLADNDGDDLFSDLKNLEVDQLFETPSAPAAVTQQLDPVKTAPPRTSQSDLLQAQLDGLAQELRAKEQELRAKDQELRAKDQELVGARAEAQAARSELQQTQRQMDSATRNLEELEQRQKHADRLHAELAEAQAALQRLEGSAANAGADLDALKAQLRATLEEKQEHLHQNETLNQQVAEKTQKAIELLRERDRLQGLVLELEPFKAQTEQAQRELSTARSEAQGAKARLEAMEEMLQRLPVVEKELAASNTELGKARTEAQQLDAALKELSAKHQALETAHAASERDLKATQDQAGSLRQEMSGLEATMRGQGRELAQLQERIQSAEATAQQAAAEAAEFVEKLKVKDDNLEKMGNEIFSISAQRNDLQQRLEDCMHARENERMELMQGLDEKEAELQRLQEDGQELAREKQSLEGQLAERVDRLASLNALLTDLSDRLKKGADLAQG